MSSHASDRTDWHQWLKNLDVAGKKALVTEIVRTADRRNLGPFARQYYIHLAIASENQAVRELSDEMVFAQLEGDDKHIGQVEDRIYAIIRKSLIVRDEPA